MINNYLQAQQIIAKAEKGAAPKPLVYHTRTGSYITDSFTETPATDKQIKAYLSPKRYKEHQDQQAAWKKGRNFGRGTIFPR